MRQKFNFILLIFTVLFVFCSCSQSKKEIKIGFEFNSFEKDNMPYTEIFFKFLNESEEKTSVGTFVGQAYLIESFDDREFINKNSLIGCQVFYAGGGDNIFVYLEEEKLIVKHIEFVLGNDEVESSVLKEEVVLSRKIPDGAIVRKYE